jgi:transposase
MNRYKISDEQWPIILAVLRAHPKVRVGDEAQCRRFVEAVLSVTRTGAPWRDVPASGGDWNALYHRYASWCEHGVWEALFEACQILPEEETLILDSTVVRAHPSAAGAPKARGGQEAQGLGRSRGGFSSKLHLAGDGLGGAQRILLTGGERHDSTQAEALLEGFSPEVVIADRSYDADRIRAPILALGAEPVIPPRSNRTDPPVYDQHLYKERSLIACFIGKIKHFRRVFTRYDKLASRYLGFVFLAAALVWLR